MVSIWYLWVCRFLESLYLYKIPRIHRHNAEPQDLLLPPHAFGQLQQSDCKSGFRQTLADQCEIGGCVDEDMHANVPHRGDIACRPLCGNDDIVDCKDHLRDDQLKALSQERVGVCVPR